MPTLVVPGVQVQARFDVLPPLPAPSGIVGVVGVVDRPPDPTGLVAVSKVGELIEILGPGTLVTLPQAVHALTNGASEVVVAPVVGETAPASATLVNGDGNPAVVLRTRADGGWGNKLAVEARAVTLEGNVVRSTIRLLLDGGVVEEFADARIESGAPDDLFDRINSRSRYIVAVDANFDRTPPPPGSHQFDADTETIPIVVNEKTLFELRPAPGVDPNGLRVEFTGGTRNRVGVKVFQGGLQEQFPDLEMNPDSANHLPYALLTRSRLVRAVPRSSLPAGKELPATQGPLTFANGKAPSVDDYRAAIDRFADDARIDLVVAAPDAALREADVHAIHQALVAHCETMAENGAPRIAFGSVTPAEEQRNTATKNLELIRSHSALVRSRRMVLVAPAGAAGAVAGLVGRMNPQESPTFKTVPLHGVPPAQFREGELNRLLGSAVNLLVVQNRAGRGVVVLKGIDTTGDQISVTRVADQCIRETKAISENFIGRLNDDNARAALKQQLVATFTRMERQGALVPSTDGTDPAFLVDVYSTQLDFAQGIVRIDIAVRPVRAIDYVYATIRVKN